MKEKILLISTCKEKLHELEFVKPIEEILKKNNILFFTKNYLEIKEPDLKKCSSVIICGTSLKDNEFLGNMNYFRWILGFDKPILGICAGMQILGYVFGGNVKKKTEIGYFVENFEGNFLGLSGEVEVYHLHNNFIDFEKLDSFEIYSKNNNVVQAVKHKEKLLYGVLFHPEVRNKNLILEFLNNE